MIITPSHRTDDVKEYYFSVKNRQIAEINKHRREPVINLGIGAPDQRPPQAAIDALCAEAQKDGVHKYQSYVGIPELREAFSRFYRRHYGVALDPDREIQPLTGSKEGILIISLAFLDKGDKVLVPNPGYPTYTSAARLCEAEIVKYDLLEQTGWQPDWDQLESMDLTGVKMIWTNYPNMPTGGRATMDTYRRLVEFGKAHSILVCNDNPYSFVLNDDPISIMAVEGAKEVCLEMNSLSKSHNMSGWRLGMVTAEEQTIRQILKVKTQLDSGIFRPLQVAAVAALDSPDEWYSDLNAEYRRRKEVACRIMDALGAVYDPRGQGLFVWGRIGGSAAELSDKILLEAGVFVTPGFIFGSNGENYIRISLCASTETLLRAYDKICALQL